MAPTVPVRTQVEAFELERANDAIARVRDGGLRGAAVVVL